MSDNKSGVKRRSFFSGVAAGGAAMLASLPEKATAQPAPQKPSATMPPATVAAAESKALREQPVVEGRSGSDYMVDVIKSLDIEYVAAMPGSTFRGLHEPPDPHLSDGRVVPIWTGKRRGCSRARKGPP